MADNPVNLAEGDDIASPSAITGDPKNWENIDPVKEEKGDKKIKPTIWQRIPALSGAGFILAIIVLSIVAVYIFFLIFYIVKDQSNEDIKAIFQQKMPETNPDSAFNHKLELIKALQQRNKEYRDYSFQMSQMILLNLLLPILTGILGYIFGTREERREEQANR